jgi:hypothetical protein
MAATKLRRVETLKDLLRVIVGKQRYIVSVRRKGGSRDIEYLFDQIDRLKCVDRLVGLRKLHAEVNFGRQLSRGATLRMHWQDFVGLVRRLEDCDATQSSARVTRKSPIEEGPTTQVNGHEQCVLMVLAALGKRRLHQSEIVAELRCRAINEIASEVRPESRQWRKLSIRTVGDILKRLIDKQLIHTPEGPRSGYAITDAGRQYIRAE